MPRRLESAHKAQGCRTTALTASSHAKRSLTYRDTSRPAARRHGSAGVPAKRYRRSREKRKPGCGTASPGSLHACEANLKAELSCFAAVRTSESEPRSLCRTRKTTDTPAPPPRRAREFESLARPLLPRRSGEAKRRARPQFCTALRTSKRVCEQCPADLRVQLRHIGVTMALCQPLLMRWHERRGASSGSDWNCSGTNSSARPSCQPSDIWTQ